MKRFKTTIATVLCSASVLCTCCSAFADVRVTTYDSLTVNNSSVGTLVRDKTSYTGVNTDGDGTVNTGDEVIINGSVVGTILDKDRKVIIVKPKGNADMGAFKQTLFNNSVVGTHIQDSFKYFDVETR